MAEQTVSELFESYSEDAQNTIGRVVANYDEKDITEDWAKLTDDQKSIAYFIASLALPDEAAHFGVKGMRWGVRKGEDGDRSLVRKLLGDSKYWSRYRKIAGLGAAGLVAAQVIPGVLPATLVVAAGGAINLTVAMSIASIAAYRTASDVNYVNYLIRLNRGKSDLSSPTKKAKYTERMKEKAAKKGELKQFGVRGMRWGIRRTDKQIAKETLALAAKGEPVTPTKKLRDAEIVGVTANKGGGATVTIAARDESSADRYSRLASEAKAGTAKDWDETDLKFFNARTEALSKVNRMFQKDQSWLRKTTEKVIQQSAQAQMQAIANGIANKYITQPLLDAVNNDTKAILAESKTPIDYVGKHRAKKK